MRGSRTIRARRYASYGYHGTSTCSLHCSSFLLEDLYHRTLALRLVNTNKNYNGDNKYIPNSLSLRHGAECARYYVCMYMYVCMYVCMCAHTHTYIYIYIYIHIYNFLIIDMDIHIDIEIGIIDVGIVSSYGSGRRA